MDAGPTRRPKVGPHHHSQKTGQETKGDITAGLLMGKGLDLAVVRQGGGELMMRWGAEVAVTQLFAAIPTDMDGHASRFGEARRFDGNLKARLAPKTTTNISGNHFD